uniref:Putative V-type proton ATPase subunit E n=1 Tax=Davidia involucrata TaxID=16924 RepID=A0A5B6Z3E2_DAVIN
MFERKLSTLCSSILLGSKFFKLHHHVYKKLLQDLIVQSLLRLKEPAVLLRCRKDDLHLVESVLHSAKEEYAENANVHPPEIIVDNVHLPPAPSHHDAHGPFCSGGVVLASRDGKIVCENTLDARLDVVFRKKLPEIRKHLFGQVAA